MKQGLCMIDLEKFLLLLLCGNVASNRGPTNFWFVNYRSILNKGPLLHDLIQCRDLDILALAETHIRPTDTNVILTSLTSANYNFFKNLQCTGLDGGVGFQRRKISSSIVSSPVFRSFESIILSFKSVHNIFVAVPPTRLMYYSVIGRFFCCFEDFCHKLVPISSFVAT